MRDLVRSRGRGEVYKRQAKRKGNETDLHDRWRAQCTAGEQTAIDSAAGCQLATNGGRMPAGSVELAGAGGAGPPEKTSRGGRAPGFAGVARPGREPTVWLL